MIYPQSTPSGNQKTFHMIDPVNESFSTVYFLEQNNFSATTHQHCRWIGLETELAICQRINFHSMHNEFWNENGYKVKD